MGEKLSSNGIVASLSQVSPPFLQTVSTAPKDTQIKNLIITMGASPTRSNETDTHGKDQSLGVQVVVAGAVTVDLSCDFLPDPSYPCSLQPLFKTSNPAKISQSIGGVGRNVATALQQMKVPTLLCSKVGDDIAGSAAMEMLKNQQLEISGIVRSASTARTAQYVAINDAQKNLVIAMADVHILQNDDVVSDETARNSLLPQWVGHSPDWLVVDANWDSKTLRAWLQEGKSSGAKLAFEPTSAAKSKRLFIGTKNGTRSPTMPTFPNPILDLATPNSLELASMHEAAREVGLLEQENWFQVINSIGLSSTGSRDKFENLTNKALVDQGVPQQAVQLLPFIPCIIATLGEQGVLLAQLLRPGDDRLTSPTAAPYLLSRSADSSGMVGGVYMRLFPAVEEVAREDIVSVNGVGDTLLGLVIAGLTRSPYSNVEDLIDIAQRGSVLTLKSKENVSPQISSLKGAILGLSKNS